MGPLPIAYNFNYNTYFLKRYLLLCYKAMSDKLRNLD